MKNIIGLALLCAVFVATPAFADPVASGTGTLSAASPVQVDRVFRDSLPSTWGDMKGFPGTISGSYAYALIDGTHPSNAVQDIYYEITFTNLTSTQSQPFAVAYDGAFDPNDISLNYIGDSGSSSSNGVPQIFQVMVAAGGSLSVVFSEVVNGFLPFDYSYTIDAYSDANYGENFLPVPEPTSWAMMIGGFGLVGAAMRRRTPKVMFAA